ncbi:MAG TPA: ATP synthase subunit F [Clostridiales bacterium]|nr:ATP synthase subunit F [Clostridiales bacterium]
MRYFVISDNTDTHVGLRLAGVEGVIARTREECLKALDKVMEDPSIGVLLINEGLAEQCAAELAPHKMSGRTPLVVEIPDRHGVRNKDAIARYIREAIGVKI